MLKNQNQIAIALLLLISVCIACNLNDETDEANKLVDAGNEIIDKNKNTSDEANKLLLKLMGDDLVNAKDIQKYKDEKKSEFDKLVKLSEDSLKMNAEVVEKFDKASKLDTDEIFKEYISIKVKELQKRGEGEKLQLSTIKEFIETKDIDKINKLIEDLNKNIVRINEEADELEKKANQIAADNSEVIKK